MKKISTVLLIVIYAVLGAMAVGAQERGPNTNEDAGRYNTSFVVQEINKDSLLAWREKVILHLADDIIPNKSTLFFKGYLLSKALPPGDHLSKVLKVELLDEQGAVVKKQYHPIEEGMVLGNMDMPKKLSSGKYYLRAYTRWMQNYGTASYAVKQVYIGTPGKGGQVVQKSPPEVEIIPEGGTMLNGLTNRLVIHTDQAGFEPEGSTGVIEDRNGRVVSTLTRYPSGLFSTTFRPETGTTYKLKMSEVLTYNLPEVQKAGCLIHVNNLDPEKARIRVIASPDFYGRQLKIIGEIDGISHLERYINMNDRGKVEFELAKNGIPRGVLWLRLVGDANNEISRRPIWIEGEEININLNISSLDDAIPGELVLELQLTDEENKPVEAEVALSITEDKKDQRPLDNAPVDFNELDLFPSRPGKSDYSASGEQRKDRFMADLRLLVSAPDLENDKIPEAGESRRIEYPFQQGLELIGYAYDMNNSLLRNTPIQVMAFSETDIWVQDIQTDSDGRLVLENLQFQGEAELVFRTKGDQSQERMVKVIPAKNSKTTNSAVLAKTIKSQERKRVYEPTEDIATDTTGLITLKEVVVRETSKKKTVAGPSSYSVEATQVRFQDPKRPKTIPQLLLNIPGVIVNGLGSPYPTVSIPKVYGPILWVIDGLPLSQTNTSAGPAVNGLFEVMNLVMATDVERIELLLGANAAVFGSRASGGVFVVYTRSGAEFRNTYRKESQLVFQGYEPIVDFKAYLTTGSKKARLSAKTLYWNPSIKTNEEGKATIRIPDLDNIGNQILIQASTVTIDGRFGAYNAVMTVGSESK